MKKILITIACATLIVACKKENNVQTLTKTFRTTSLIALLPGNWQMKHQVVTGPLVNINQDEVPLTIPITLTSWVNPSFPLSVDHDTLIIPVYVRFGSDSTWTIHFTDNDNFTLENRIKTGFYKNTQITDTYIRVP